MRRLVVLSLLVAGCVTEDNVLEKVSASSCRRDRECNQADFEANYADLEACVTDGVDALDGVQTCEIAAGCVYSPEEADGCLKAIHQEDCGAYNSGDHGSACDNIYSCSTGQLIDVGLCLLGG